MSAVKKLQLVSVDEYLAGELVSPIKHEYLGGIVYAMAGARNVHNTIAGNVFASLHTRLRGRKCRPFNSDTKVRVRLPTQVRFYYPDVSITYRPNPPNDSFQDAPTVLLEIPSLSAYVLLEQGSAKSKATCRSLRFMTPSSSLPRRGTMPRYKWEWMAMWEIIP